MFVGKSALIEETRKATRLIFLDQDTWILYGNMMKDGDASASPGKSYLFFLTAYQSLESI